MHINIPHNEVIQKSFATTLFIYSGTCAYDFIHKNMQKGLPLPRSMQQADYCIIQIES